MNIMLIVIIMLISSNIFLCILLLLFKKNQKRVKEFKEAVNNSNRNGIFISRDTIHGIKNSISNIMTFIQILKKEADVIPEFKEYFTLIQNSSEKILFLISSILPKSTEVKSDDQTFIEPVPELPNYTEIKKQLDNLQDYHISALARAINTLDVELSNQIIAEISGYNKEAAAILSHLVKDYRFDLLQSVMESSKKSSIVSPADSSIRASSIPGASIAESPIRGASITRSSNHDKQNISRR